MTSDVKTTKMVKNECTRKECTIKNYDAFVTKPRMSLLNDVYCKICSNIDDASLVEGTAGKCKTNCNADSSGFISKTQRLGKKRIKYTKLYELTEIPERSDTYTRCIPKSSGAEERLANPRGETVNITELKSSCSTDMNKKVEDKSSVEPFAPVDTTRKEAVDASINSFEKEPTSFDKKAKPQNKSSKKSKNHRKNMSKGCSRVVVSIDSFSVKITTKENKTNLSDPPKTFNTKTQNAGKRRIKYTKLYELTEIPEKSDVRSCCTTISSNVQENIISPREEIGDKPELVNSCSIVMIEKVVDKSSVEPIAPVDITRKETVNAPDNLLENKSTALDVNTEQFKSKTAKKSKKQRKIMSKACTRDVSCNVKIATSENKTNLNGPPKAFITKIQNAGKCRIKFTKLYELTEISEKSDIQ